MTPIPLIIVGALGRMGQTLIKKFSNDARFEIIGAVISSRPEQNAPNEWEFPVVSELDQLVPHLRPKTLIVDFSHFSKLESLVTFASRHKCSLLVGTTGHPSAHMTLLSRAAEYIGVLFAPNTSIMANLMIEFSHLAAATLPHSAVLINDIHHRHKKDAPSGTALAIKKAIEGAEAELDQDMEINCARIAEVMGEHSVRFFKKNECLEISHKVFDRAIFAEGALFAALFLSQQGPGLYDMADVLNLNMTIENRPN